MESSLLKVYTRALMTLNQGTKLGSYEILETLGTGGQGAVYKATDTRLGRLVAIKVLHAEFSGQEEFRQRFEREAQTIAGLNHPHICTLYDVGQQDGTSFLVMEFLEGETLASRLGRGSLPLDEALKIAAQISEALDKAHSLGVTHRDLKPGNVMLTESGAKLMDFGLAKRRAAVNNSSSSMVPTAMADLTQHGSIIGTVQYMAPEQIEGEEADQRTDIFALGVVLYEMVTGKRAFSGKSQASLMASILHNEPAPLSTVHALTPLPLQRVVEVCLAKDPRERWQTAHDVTLQLKWIAAGGVVSGVPAASTTPLETTKRPGKLPWLVAAAAILAALVLAIPYFRESQAEARVIRFPIFPNEGTAFGPEGAGIRPFPAISPDGNHIVFQAQRPNEPVFLWVRSLNELDARRLDGTEGAAFPFWSADGQSIAFTANSKLKRISASGGPVQILCDVSMGTAQGSWNLDGTIVFAEVSGGLNPNKGILRVQDTGGMPTVVIPPNPDRKESGLLTPSFLADGKHFVYLAQSPGTPNELYVGSLDSSEAPKRLTPADSHALYSSGYLLFVQQGNLRAQEFNPDTLELSGSPLTVAESVRTNVSNGRSAFSASANGTLVYRTGLNFGAVGLRVVWYDREGKPTDTINQRDDNQNPYLSPDEKQLLVRRVPEGENPGCKNCNDLWTIDLVRGTNTRMTFGKGDPFAGGWSPDGTRILYRTNPDGQYSLYTKPATGVGTEDLLLKFDHEINGVWDWSRDGKFVLFTAVDPQTGTDIWVLPVSGDRKPIPFINVPANQSAPRFSADSRWIAYQSDESGRSEVYIQPFPPDGRRVQISVSGGGQPRWRRDGKELFFSQARTVMAADIKETASTIEAGQPRRLFLSPLNSATSNMAVTADGERFLISVPAGSAISDTVINDDQPLVVVTNWAATLKQ